MIQKRLILGLLTIITFLGISATKAQAISFAEYIYLNTQKRNFPAVLKYTQKGYNIDAVDYNGMSALCLAAQNKDYKTYNLLLKLGAAEKQSCLTRTEPLPQVTETKSITTGTSNVSSSNSKGLYIGAGVLALGAGAALALSGGGGGSKSHHASPDPSKTCDEGYHLEDGECVPDTPICPTGYHLEDDECVPDETTCPTGERLIDGQCVPIICPPNTHLVGNLCVADGTDIDHTGDGDVYGIASEAEDVFNLYSSPSYPDDEDSIIINNTGNGNVYGIYGYKGETFNSYIVGYNSQGIPNPKPIGTAEINITDHGNGTVYGMYSHISDITQYKEAINAAAWNNGTAYGNIIINHTGQGSSYGLAGDVRAYNAYAAYGANAYGNITINGEGDIYGVHGYVAATNAVAPWYGGYVKGDININSTGDGNIYGMMINKDDIPGAGAGGSSLASWFAFNAYSGVGKVDGTINIHNTGNGNVYGMYGGQQLYNAMSYGGKNEDGSYNSPTLGIINITNFGNGDIYGMYLPDADTKSIIANVDNNGSTSIINLTNLGSGVSTGLRGGIGNRIMNSGTININNLGDGTAVGIYGEQASYITNSGNINIYRQAFTDTTDEQEYEPLSPIGGNAYGIYAKSGAVVENSGTIMIENAQNGSGIYLEAGATLENTGTVIFNSTEDSIVENGPVIDIYGTNSNQFSNINLNNFGNGEIILGTNGQFFANTLSGNMSVSNKTTFGNFDNTYTYNNALQSQNISDLHLKSKSAMFKANPVYNNDTNSYDVVLTRNNFNTLLKNKDLANFFEKNYINQNNLTIYDHLKTLDNVSSLNKTANNLTGNDIIPSFNKENRYLYQEISRLFNNNLFNNPTQNYIAGYQYSDLSHSKDKNLIKSQATAHSAYGMLKNKTDNNLTYGLGVSISQINSDYDNNSNRKSNIFGLWAPIGMNINNDTSWFSKAYLGYEDGSYDRITSLNKYSADINTYQYGLSNELRHQINLPIGMKLTPTAELNLLGIYQDKFDEGNKNSAIHSNKENELFLTGGLGAYLSKEIAFSDEQTLGLEIGGIYYVEFLDDKGISAHMNGMDEKYKLKYKEDSSYAVISARINYNYKNLTLFGRLEQETRNLKALTINAGLQYNM